MVCSANVKASVVTTMGTYHDKVSDTCESYFERYNMQIISILTLLHCINLYPDIQYQSKVLIGTVVFSLETYFT